MDIDAFTVADLLPAGFTDLPWPALVAALPTWLRAETGSPASTQAIDAAEAALGTDLPEDYRQLLAHADGIRLSWPAEPPLGESWLQVNGTADLVRARERLREELDGWRDDGWRDEPASDPDQVRQELGLTERAWAAIPPGLRQDFVGGEFDPLRFAFNRLVPVFEYDHGYGTAVCLGPGGRYFHIEPLEGDLDVVAGGIDRHIAREVGEIEIPEL